MSAIEGAGVISPGYNAETLGREGGSVDLPTESPVVSASSNFGDDLTPLLAAGRGEAASPSGKDVSGGLSGIAQAISRVAVALIDLLSTLLNSQKRPETRDGAGVVAKTPPTSATPISKANTSTPSAPQPAATTSGLQAVKDERGVVTVRSPDGYVVKAEGHHQAWTITAPDGKTTRIFGDPHVRESDGTTWDFTEQSTFVFGKSKATVETVPARNGMTLSRQVTIYNGHERVTIGGIDTNQPVIVALAGDGRQHDDGLSDGVHYVRRATKNGESWVRVVDGKKKTMGVK